jgi:NADPH-dependent 2,4-dienoyl-CoA reductase/sulfur reductase-like enzyme
VTPSHVCDVLVVGAGPAGIAAAVGAAAREARVVIIDEAATPGGQIWRSSSRIPPPRAARRWLRRLRESGAAVESRAGVVDVERRDQAFHVIVEREHERLLIDARSIVIATGARERFLPFPGWTLPNVFGVGGTQALLKSGMTVRGKRVVLAGSGPLLLPVAASLSHAGARVLLVAEQAPAERVVRFARALWRRPLTAVQAARFRAAFVRAPYVFGTWVTAAHGDERVASVELADAWGGRRRLDCDVLCAAFGLVPNLELARLLGCALLDGFVRVDDQQATSSAGVYCAGEPTGIGGVDLALAEGAIAGSAAAGGPPDDRRRRHRDRLRRAAADLDVAFALRPEVRSLADDSTIVCRCEDVRLGQLDASWTVRQAKLYTRAGMGACQGRICGGALECVRSWSPDTVRPPLRPARVSTLLPE